MADSFPYITMIGVVLVSLNLFGDKLSFSNSNFPFNFISEVPVGSPCHMIVGFLRLLAPAVPGPH